MASGVVRIEGKEISLDQEIIDAGIPAIKAVLSVDFPAIENAEIEIVSPSAGAPRVATVVKRGTGKGAVTTATCDICDEPTDQVKTGRCDRCWKLLREIQASPERARRALAVATAHQPALDASGEASFMNELSGPSETAAAAVGQPPDRENPTHNEIIKGAIVHLLNRVKNPRDSASRVIGPGTASFDKLTTVAALLFGEPVDRVREFYSRSYPL